MLPDSVCTDFGANHLFTYLVAIYGSENTFGSSLTGILFTPAQLLLTRTIRVFARFGKWPLKVMAAVVPFAGYVTALLTPAK